MKKSFLVIWVLTLSGLYSCKSNYLQYHRLVCEAEYSFYNEDYENAENFYAKAFRKVNIPVESDMYFYSVSAWEVGERDKAIELLDTLYGLEWKLTKSGYFQGMDTILRAKLIKENKVKRDEIDRRRESHPYFVIFDSIDARDQRVRRNWENVMFKYPGDTLKRKLAWMEVDRIDSLNLITVDSLIDIHGFIGGAKFPAHPKIMHLTMLHQLEWVYSNPRIFKKAIKEGSLLPEGYAIGYDKALLILYGKSNVKYGQFRSELSDVSPEKVFKNSKKIGVSPYYSEWVFFPGKRGLKPQQHFFYEYYKSKKSSFC